MFGVQASACPGRAERSLRNPPLKRGQNCRNQRVQITLEAQMRDLMNWRFRIGVDRDDMFAVSHAGQVMTRAGDPAGNIKIRFHSAACLPDLSRLWNPAEV